MSSSRRNWRRQRRPTPNARRRKKLPASSVSGIYLAHPEARYFPIGQIDRDQVRDYSARKGETQSHVERWLGPSLAYDTE